MGDRLFGRIRSLTKMALEEYLAQESSYRAARLSLISAVATAYYTYATDRENLMLSKDTLKTQEENYILIKSQYESGIMSEIDLHRARTQVETDKRGSCKIHTRLLRRIKTHLIYWQESR